MLNETTGSYRLAAGSDYKTWLKDSLVHYLYDCAQANTDATIDITPEAASFRANGIYNILDRFCEHTGYARERITIRTGNMLEHHNAYRVQRVATAWYELTRMRSWIRQNPITPEFAPTYHFGHFVGKSNWNRLWTGAIMHSRYADKTLQTYNCGIGTHYLRKSQDLVDYLGLEDLVEFGCDILPEVVNFLKDCPKTIAEDVEFITGKGNYINQSQDCYPIQMPNNLNIINYYNSIFVDVAHETYMADGVFFCTEKTWRPIIARRPFVSVTPVNHLANLKRLGFRTFSNYWDEGYDEYGLVNRIREVNKVLEKISRWSPTELAEALADMQEIFEHNYQTLLSLTATTVEKIFVNDN
jgi:hypothetical protein